MNDKQQEKIKADFEKERPDKHPFDTLLKNTFNSGDQRGYSNTWYPAPKCSLEDAFSIFDKESKDKFDLVIQNNIIYSLQYLHFLEKELEELYVSDVLYAILVKTYVITSVSIIEGLYSYLLKAKNIWTPKEWKELISYESKRATVINGKKCKLRTKIFYEKTVDENDEYKGINIGDIITTKKYYNFLQLDVNFKKELEDLKNLRNRVHLQNMHIESEKDHDYNAFTKNTKYKAGSILYRVLTSNGILKSTDIVDFLKANIEKYESTITTKK